MIPLGRYLRTIIQLRPRQIGHLVYRRLRPITAVRPSTMATPSLRGVAFRAPWLPARSCVHGERLRFLNRDSPFTLDEVDWRSVSMPRLWRYHLHYGDYLRAPGVAPDRAHGLIRDWIAANPLNAGDGWEPYPVSLRMVNWVKLLLTHAPAADMQMLVTRSLRDHARWLERNLEWHLLGNHLFENARALTFAGAYLAGPDADRWLQSGLELLAGETDEQILADGGHFERSPMYHCLVLEGLLDVLNLLAESGHVAVIERLAHIETGARRAMDFLAAITLPDGSLPLFNDAVTGIAAGPAELAAYGAAVLGCSGEPARKDVLAPRAFDASGYYVIRDGNDAMVIDCGAIGPDYQPGHAHCDTLSYELCLQGRRVVVDAGVHDYEAGTARRYARSTAAHNTVVVDGEEQSEIWGVFRVGRRARPLAASLRRTGADTVTFEGAHDGYRVLPGRPVHRREIDYERGAEWSVRDVVTGAGEHTIDSYVHLHPDLTVRGSGTTVTVHGPKDDAVATIECRGGEMTIEEGDHYPEFGLVRRNAVLRLSARGRLPLELAYTVRNATA